MDTTKGFDMITSRARDPPHIVMAFCASIVRLLSVGKDGFCGTSLRQGTRSLASQARLVGLPTRHLLARLLLQPQRVSVSARRAFLAHAPPPNQR